MKLYFAENANNTERNNDFVAIKHKRSAPTRESHSSFISSMSFSGSDARFSRVSDSNAYASASSSLPSTSSSNLSSSGEQSLSSREQQPGRVDCLEGIDGDIPLLEIEDLTFRAFQNVRYNTPEDHKAVQLISRALSEISSVGAL